MACWHREFERVAPRTFCCLSHPACSSLLGPRSTKGCLPSISLKEAHPVGAGPGALRLVQERGWPPGLSAALRRDTIIPFSSRPENVATGFLVTSCLRPATHASHLENLQRAVKARRCSIPRPVPPAHTHNLWPLPQPGSMPLEWEDIRYITRLCCCLQREPGLGAWGEASAGAAAPREPLSGLFFSRSEKMGTDRLCWFLLRQKALDQT